MVLLWLFMPVCIPTPPKVQVPRRLGVLGLERRIGEAEEGADPLLRLDEVALQREDARLALRLHLGSIDLVGARHHLAQRLALRLGRVAQARRYIEHRRVAAGV
jgi:hypothetical protein